MVRVYEIRILDVWHILQDEVGFMPKVSVIVPVYKIKEDYLNACVKSVLE